MSQDEIKRAQEQLLGMLGKTALAKLKAKPDAAKKKALKESIKVDVSTNIGEKVIDAAEELEEEHKAILL